LRCETFWEIEVSQSKKIWWGIPLFCEKKIKNPFLGSNIPFFSKLTKNQKNSGKSPSRDSLTCHLYLFFKLQKQWYLISNGE
jgi:hypothetical protein